MTDKQFRKRLQEVLPAWARKPKYKKVTRGQRMRMRKETKKPVLGQTNSSLLDFWLGR